MLEEVSYDIKTDNTWRMKNIHTERAEDGHMYIHVSMKERRPANGVFEKRRNSKKQRSRGGK